METEQGSGAQGMDSIPTDQMEQLKIFVGGISWHSTHDSLQKYFTQFGPVSEVIVKKHEGGKARGFAFVTFETRAGMDAVFAPDKVSSHMIDDRPVEVKRAMTQEKQRAMKQRTNRLWVAVRPNVETKAIKEYFQHFGEIEDVAVKVDPTTNRRRGFVFVIFKSEDSVEEVMKVISHSIEGRQIIVKRAENENEKGGKMRGMYSGGTMGQGPYRGRGAPRGRGFGRGAPRGGAQLLGYSSGGGGSDYRGRGRGGGARGNRGRGFGNRGRGGADYGNRGRGRGSGNYGNTTNGYNNASGYSESYDANNASDYGGNNYSGYEESYGNTAGSGYDVGYGNSDSGYTQNDYGGGSNGYGVGYGGNSGGGYEQGYGNNAGTYGKQESHAGPVRGSRGGGGASSYQPY